MVIHIWSDNSTGSSIENLAEGLYSVTVTDLNGCSVTNDIPLESENEICLDIPEAISPNKDLINDVWEY